MTIPLYKICENTPVLAEYLRDEIGLKVSEFSNSLSFAPPFVSWQIIHASTEMYLSDVPDMDNISVQIDIYAKTRAEVRRIAGMLRLALHEYCYVVRLSGPEQDFDTDLWRIMMETAWLEEPQY